MTEFAEIYETYFRNVELYLRAICRDDSLAEELTEQVFFQALKALPSFRGDCDIHVWLCAMARNLYLSHFRREKIRWTLTSFKFLTQECQWKNKWLIGSRPW